MARGWERDGSNGEEAKAASGTRTRTRTGANGLTHSVGGTVAGEGDKRKELDWAQKLASYMWSTATHHHSAAGAGDRWHYPSERGNSPKQTNGPFVLFTLLIFSLTLSSSSHSSSHPPPPSRPS